MAHAKECDSCGDLFKPEKGTVALEYRVCEGGNSYQCYSADDHDDSFALCSKCSGSFLAFIKHEGERGDGVPGVPLDYKDALRWRWWCKWWLDEKDDSERVNAIEYHDEASFNAAVDAEIAVDAGRPSGVGEPRNMNERDRDLLLYGSHWTRNGKRIDPRDIYIIQPPWWVRLVAWFRKVLGKGTSR